MVMFTVDYTKEMEDWFVERTNKHIALVGKYIDRIYRMSPIIWADLRHRAKNHDSSKFEEPERTPYIYRTWKQKKEDEGEEWVLAPEMEKMLKEAVKHHVLTNSHHVEFHARKVASSPGEIIYGYGMGDLDLAEMVADWCAMSEERKDCPLDWAENNINSRWKFSKTQIEFIYNLLNEIWWDYSVSESESRSGLIF